MERRLGPSISVKMILTTTALIVIIIAGFGALNVWNILQVFNRNVAEKQDLFARELESVGSATVRALEAASRGYLQNNQDAEVRASVADLIQPELIRDAKDRTIDFVYVLDPNLPNVGLVAHSDPTKNPKEGHPPFADDPSWKRILAAWNERKAQKGDGPFIESLELTDPSYGHVALFAKPIFRSDVPAAAISTTHTVAEDPDPSAAFGRLGFVVVGLSYRRLEAAIETALRQKTEAFQRTIIRTALVGALFILLGAALAILQGLRISKPIKMLAWRADQIARGDLETRVEVTSTDEIGLLGENFNYMADQLAILLRQTAEQATMEKELEVARTIQETLVPGTDVVDRQFVKLAGYFQPASQCGGDWWTYHDLKDGKVLVVIGDVTGHGVPSAMITAAAKAACDVARSVHDADVTVEKLLEIMNGAIFESAKRKFVMTCFASIINPKDLSITYANAGHNFPYLYRQADGRGEFGSLMTRGNRLGDLAESKYTSRTTELLPGDVLVWYTDGIVECENEKGEEYGEKRFRSSIRRAAHMDPAEMREVVVNASQQFFGERQRKDDITMVVGRVYG